MTNYFLSCLVYKEEFHAIAISHTFRKFKTRSHTITLSLKQFFLNKRYYQLLSLTLDQHSYLKLLPLSMKFPSLLKSFASVVNTQKVFIAYANQTIPGTLNSTYRQPLDDFLGGSRNDLEIAILVIFLSKNLQQAFRLELQSKLLLQCGLWYVSTSKSLAGCVCGGEGMEHEVSVSEVYCWQQTALSFQQGMYVLMEASRIQGRGLKYFACLLCFKTYILI